MSENLKKRYKNHSNIARSMEKCDIYNHLSQYFSCPFYLTYGHFISILLETKKVMFVVICWTEKWAPIELRQPSFMIIWFHKTSGELKYRITELRRTYMISLKRQTEVLTERETPNTLYIKFLKLILIKINLFWKSLTS